MKILILISLLISFNIHAETLNGFINGKPWQFTRGKVALIGGEYNLFFWETEGEDICNSWSAMGDNTIQARFSSLDVGHYPLGYSRFIVLSYLRSDGWPWNIITERGHIAISKIEDGLLYGNLSGQFNSDNNVSGDFVLTICEE